MSLARYAMRRSAGVAVLGLAIALAGCVLDGPRHREEACVVTGCSGERCAGQPEVTPCIWHDAYACYRDATCEQQPGGACGWTPTSELSTCLASHAPPPGP